MQLENLFKSWFTTLLGAGILVVIGYEYFWDDSISDMQAVWGAIGGFALMWMRDKISIWIGDVFTALLDKFKK